MNEELLQYIWMAGLFDANSLYTKDGQEITVYRRGRLNTDSGPDFTNAHVRIDYTDWFGNIEIHLNSEQWYEHKHHLDKAYNNTILHVVLNDNKICYRADGSVLPCIELKNKIAESTIVKYKQLKQSKNWIPCFDAIKSIDHFTVQQQLERVLSLRLENKSAHLELALKKTNNNWDEVFYFALARSLGFGTNSEAFEQLAHNMPLNIILKHQNQPLQIEAMTFGIAGFLEEDFDDVYFQQLKQEWQFLKSKYSLHTLDKSSFKFMRMRPGNFPGLRLAQFAAIAGKCPELFKQICISYTLENLKDIFQIQVSDYWNEHYQFGKTSSQHRSNLSQQAINQILINAVVPTLFIYGKTMGDAMCCEKALNLLQLLPAEDNVIIRNWQTLNIKANTAFDSQALIELKKNHCDLRKCLNCKIGTKVIN